ncbi:MAG: transglutaminase domain-containing protein [Sedimentisphaerales bacterium]|nr:transglutaminase domain-containing protein [Sedimentisphaerales bacterium]
MKTQRWMAVVLVAVVSALTALAVNGWRFALIMGLLGLVGTRRRLTWELPRVQHLIAVLLVALIFAVQYRTQLGLSAGQDLNWIALTAWQTFSRFVLSIMVLSLFLGKPCVNPLSLALFVPAAALCAGQISLIYENELLHRILETTGVLLAVVYLGFHKIPFPSFTVRALSLRRVIAAAVMLLVLNTGWIAATVMYNNQDVVNFLGGLLGGHNPQIETDGSIATSGGFHGSGKLHTLLDILLEDQGDILLRVESEAAPGYLRTEVFEYFYRNQWHPSTRSYRIRPEPAPLTTLKLPGSGNIFQLRSSQSETWHLMNLWPSPVLQAKLFTPLGATWLQIPAPWLMINSNGVCYNPQFHGGINYGLATPADLLPERIDRAYLYSCLQLPQSLDSRIETLALLLFSECRTSTEKIASVQSYFRRNYEYSLNMNIPQNTDALNHFLLEMKTGYCEYFATGAAVLLRLGGVPTRYVTGFLVNEQEPFNELWVARGSDAHAWVEAWDDQSRQWLIVEATVPSTIDPIAYSNVDYFREHLDFRRQELWSFFYEFGLLGPFIWFFQTSQTLLWWALSLPVILGIALVVVIWFLRRLNQRFYPSDPFAEEPPDQQQCHRMLQKMDSYVQQLGFHREKAETLHQFTRRLETNNNSLVANWIPQWYILYAETRYCRQPLPLYMERLQSELQQIAEQKE